MKQLGRVLTAMVTPFDRDGKVDLPTAKRLARHLVANGSDGLVIVGTTGESPTLSHDEKLAMFRAAVEAVGSDGSVVAGTGSNDTAATVALSREAEAIGVDALLLIAPYYNKPNQEGLYRHFAAVAEATRLPIILYNHPPRTGVSIAPETLARLAKIPNIVALKDSSASLDTASEFRKVTPEGFLLYSGNDSLTLPMMSVGGYGVISVASHLAGRDLHRLVDACVEGNWTLARELHYQLWDLFNGLFIAPSPAPVKAALGMVGLEVGGVRLPLVACTDAEVSRVRVIIEDLRLTRVAVEA